MRKRHKAAIECAVVEAFWYALLFIAWLALAYALGRSCD